MIGEKFELGVYSFGVAGPDSDGDFVSTAQAVRNVLEQIRLAEQVGLDFFGVGEHHHERVPVSSPTSVINAAAAMTSSITLSTAVSVLSTDDPIRLYQQAATAAIVSGDRVEIIAGRGSSTLPFPLFGYDISDYDRLYAEKFALLLAINDRDRVSWDSTIRPPLQDALVVPRPEKPLKIWLGSGGNPSSSVRAGSLGVPISYGAISGTQENWGKLGEIYRQSAAEARVAPDRLEISVASHGFVGRDGLAVKQRYHRHEVASYALANRSIPARWEDVRPNYSPGGMVFVGEPAEIAERIVGLHQCLRHRRHFLQMDIGGMPHRDVLRSIELFGTEVAPLVRAELGSR
ncbi:LLM class flavin-dependent oxidoreductase [Actinoplanes sp. TBRC 11911]|uniref:LLM class flavin-dependent oxidoreductase n=1 Tax=Actinoplanes sp. TBRC 11911 TaxID=2729386 RepID=UPI00145EFA96|nr:LLM class flavin-dependent oxidoreductase [Actinoplanes sp. TBRC 11911]NMO54872.1 LLM class flavin-dependent oxidoreductase [Actinoplanes sp. TBRC 11911]